MNKILIGTLIFIGGGAAGFLTAKTVYTKYYDKLFDEEMNSVKDVYRQQIEKLGKDLAKDTTNKMKTTYTGYKERFMAEKKEERAISDMRQCVSNDTLVRSNEGNQYNNIKQEYGITDEEGPIELDEDSEEIDDEYLEQTAYGNPAEPVCEVPYEIDAASFEGEFLEEYDKVSMDYYQVDKVLTDEIGDKLETDEVIRMIGIDAQQKLLYSNTDIIIYIRNEKLRTDFEIGTVADSYEESGEQEAAYKEELAQKSVEKTLNKVLEQKNLTPREAFELRNKVRESEGNGPSGRYA